MAIDIRATVTCSLGLPLISASISDDYLQGSGLVKCKGSCELSGIATPAIGTVVTFSYTKAGVTRQVPRKLRVLSSFADPFRRTTRVELGCKLTYLSDLKEAIDWTAFDDTANAGLSEADAEIITIPISASSVMDKCLSELGLTASSNPLTNKFSIENFDFGPGYVQVLSDLLVSESYCGYLDTDEVLQVFSLDAEGGTGPVLDSSQIIDLGPVGVGQLPGEAVVVSYSTLRLASNDIDTNTDKRLDSDFNSEQTITTVEIGYTDEDGNFYIEKYPSFNAVETKTTYQQLTLSDGKKVQVPSLRQTTEWTTSPAVLGSAYSQYLASGQNLASFTLYKTVKEYFYYDSEGNESKYDRIVFGSDSYLIGGLGIPFVFQEDGPPSFVSLGSKTINLERTIRETTTTADHQRSVTFNYGSWSETISGQQAFATVGETLTSASDATSLIDSATSGILYLTSTNISTEQKTASQQIGSGADTKNAAYADKAGQTINGRTESKAQLELALGSATAQRRIEFSLPYAPDDTFSKNSGTPVTYSAVKSDAVQKANTFGRVQNKLLLGNRNGMNLQVAAETLPAAPFAPVVVDANGLSALYRLNATSYTMDANGIVASTDALFWGAVGGTGTFWFPVAPGITTLPVKPNVVNGQMTVTSTVPVWNETVLAEGRTRVGIEVQSFSYALEALTTVPAIRTKVGFTARRIVGVQVPAASGTVAVLAPGVAIGAAALTPAAASTLAAYGPEVLSGASATVPASTSTLAAQLPMVATSAVVEVPAVVLALEFPAIQLETNLLAIQPPLVALSFATFAPAISAGASIDVPAASGSFTAAAPDYVGIEVNYFSDLALQVYGWDREFQVDWWAD
jgi:hypothetical protein